MKTPIFFLSVFLFFISTPSLAEDIVIGAVLPLSGSLSSVGQGSQKGLEIARDKINSKWKEDGRNLIIKYEDSAGDPAKAVAGFSHLKNQINYPVVYSSLTAITQALKPLTEKEKVLLIAESNTINILEGTQFTVRNFVTADAIGHAAANKFKDLNFKNISVIQAEEEWSEGVVEEMRKAEKEGSIKIGALEKVSKGELDIRSVLLRLKNKNPSADITFIILLGAAEINTIIQAKQLGIKSLAATYLCGQPQALQALKGSFEGQINIGFDVDTNSEIYKSYLTEYQKRFSSNYPEPQGMAAHDDLLIISEAIENKINSAKDIKQFLIAHEVMPGVFGRVDFDSDGDSRHSAKAQKVVGDSCLDF